MDARLKADTLRYLGVRGEAKAELISLVESVIGELKEAAVPQNTVRIFPCEVRENGVALGGTEFLSANLSKRLEGCFEAALIGVTLGHGVDRLIQRYSVSDTARAAAVQAAGAAMIEIYIEELNDAIIAEQRKKGNVCALRYSCGYGDFALSYQRKIVELLDLGKRLGITLTAGDLMLPTKSVTAIIGIKKR